MVDLYCQKNLVGRMLFVVGAAVLVLGLFGSVVLISDSYTAELGWMCFFGATAAGAHLIGLSEIVRLLTDKGDDDANGESGKVALK